MSCPIEVSMNIHTNQGKCCFSETFNQKNFYQNDRGQTVQDQENPIAYTQIGNSCAPDNSLISQYSVILDSLTNLYSSRNQMSNYDYPTTVSCGSKFIKSELIKNGWCPDPTVNFKKILDSQGITDYDYHLNREKNNLKMISDICSTSGTTFERFDAKFNDVRGALVLLGIVFGGVIIFTCITLYLRKKK